MGWISSSEFRAVWLGQWEGRSRGDQLTTSSSLSSFPSIPKMPRMGRGVWGNQQGAAAHPGRQTGQTGQMMWQGLGAGSRETFITKVHL